MRAERDAGEGKKPVFEVPEGLAGVYAALGGVLADYQHGNVGACLEGHG